MNATLLMKVIESLRSTTSRIEKEQILSDLNGTLAEDFKRIAYLAYHPRLNYFIKTADLTNIVDVEPDFSDLPDVNLSDALTFLQNSIATRKYTGHSALGAIKYIMMNLETSDDLEIFELVINKDLRIGATAKTFNKIWPDLIPIHPYMRCSGFEEKTLKNLSYPCYSQAKMDGLYVDIVVSDDSVSVYTRSGQDVTHYLQPHDAKSLKDNYSNIVLQGEALVLSDDGETFMDRKGGNGYLNSDDVDPERVVFICWDMVDYNEWSKNDGVDNTPYEIRLQNLTEVLENVSSSIRQISTEVCYTSSDIINHFKLIREDGEEGTVIKAKDGIWKSGTSKYQIKCKVVFDCELEVIGIKEGKGKYAGMLGGLLCESSDGLIEVSVGGGFTDKQRKDFFENPERVVGSIITVRANDVVNDVGVKDREVYSLFLPRFVEIRTDKSEADSLEMIQNQVKSFTDLLSMIKEK